MHLKNQIKQTNPKKAKTLKTLFAQYCQNGLYAKVHLNIIFLFHKRVLNMPLFVLKHYIDFDKFLESDLNSFGGLKQKL
jgi:hypothetical protein